MSRISRERSTTLKGRGGNTFLRKGFILRGAYSPGWAHNYLFNLQYTENISVLHNYVCVE